MVVVKGVHAENIKDSRGEETIKVFLETNIGDFSASAPSGKSTGKYEVKPYKGSLEEDIQKLKEFSGYFSEEILEEFDDLRRIEDILDGHVGGNTMFAFEAAALKALAKEKKKEIWQLINTEVKMFPKLLGNTVEGGKHAKKTHNRKPDIQEFLFIPDKKTVKENYDECKKLREEMKKVLEEKDDFFEGKTGDEHGWQTALYDKQVFEIFDTFGIDYGIDIAASSFFKRKKYVYNSPVMSRTPEEQESYLQNVLGNFKVFYVEDPFEENDFSGFAKLLERFGDRLIVGDDLTTTNYKRVEQAIQEKSINALIVKPNQIGSLIEVKRVCELAKKHDIKLVFSHRSGETNETILADLAVGFGADFFKCSIGGGVRELKVNRLIEIQEHVDS